MFFRIIIEDAGTLQDDSLVFSGTSVDTLNNPTSSAWFQHLYC